VSCGAGWGGPRAPDVPRAAAHVRACVQYLQWRGAAERVDAARRFYDWREALGEGDISMEEFADSLEKLKRLHRRFGRYIDYVVWADKQGVIDEVAVAFDRPEEYDELWGGGDCVAASPLLSNGWVVVDFCEREFGVVGDIMRDVEGASKWMWK